MHIPLNPSAAVLTPVMSVNLPKGDWVIDIKVDAVNFGAQDYIRCALFNGPSQILDPSTIYIGSGVDLVLVGELVNKVPVNSPTAALTASLQRLHDSPNGASTDMENAELWAHKSPAPIDIGSQ
jgi:hypothetical protein